MKKLFDMFTSEMMANLLGILITLGIFSTALAWVIYMGKQIIGMVI